MQAVVHDVDGVGVVVDEEVASVELLGGGAGGSAAGEGVEY